jgi:hypothetical protein
MKVPFEVYPAALAERRPWLNDQVERLSSRTGVDHPATVISRTGACSEPHPLALGQPAPTLGVDARLILSLCGLHTNANFVHNCLFTRCHGPVEAL